MIARILSGLIGVLMLLNCLWWILDPSTAAEGLAIEELCPFEYFEGTSVFGCAFQDEGLYKDSVEHYKQMKLEILK